MAVLAAGWKLMRASGVPVSAGICASGRMLLKVTLSVYVWRRACR
jgi:hypothetical protein